MHPWVYYPVEKLQFICVGRWSLNIIFWISSPWCNTRDRNMQEVTSSIYTIKVRNSTCPLARDKWIFRRTTKIANIGLYRDVWIAAIAWSRTRVTTLESCLPWKLRCVDRESWSANLSDIPTISHSDINTVIHIESRNPKAFTAIG